MHNVYQTTLLAFISLYFELCGSRGCAVTHLCIFGAQVSVSDTGCRIPTWEHTYPKRPVGVLQHKIVNLQFYYCEFFFFFFCNLILWFLGINFVMTMSYLNVKRLDMPDGLCYITAMLVIAE